MPTIVRQSGFEIRVNVRGEHHPPHVHVRKSGADVRVKLGTLEDGPSLLDVKGRLPNADIVRAVELVWLHQETLLDAWGRFNGHL
jgi:hypothetical protein